MKENIPVRHHYVPKFLMKPFCDDNENLWYWDKDVGAVTRKKRGDVFVVPNLYKDVVNHPNKPTQIESDLAKYEGEAAVIIRKFLEGTEILITPEEDEKLKLFLAIMSFRAKHVKDGFEMLSSTDSKEFYSFYQKNGDFTDFWKRNLGEIVGCRSIKEVSQNPNIDNPIKVFVLRDTCGIAGMYFMVLERRGAVDFVLSDAFPTVFEGSVDDGLSLPLYYIYPISPGRVIALIANGVESAPQEVTGLSRKFYRKPRMSFDGKNEIITVQKIYESDVRRINEAIINGAIEGYIISGKSCQERMSISIEN